MTGNISDNNALKGHKVVKGLNKNIRKLEKRKVDGLTEKQHSILNRSRPSNPHCRRPAQHHCTTYSAVGKFKVNDNEKTVER